MVPRMKTLLVLAAIVALAPACARTTPAPKAPTTTVSAADAADAADAPACKEIARLDGQPARCQAVPPSALRR